MASTDKVIIIQGRYSWFLKWSALIQSFRVTVKRYAKFLRSSRTTKGRAIGNLAFKILQLVICQAAQGYARTKPLRARGPSGLFLSFDRHASLYSYGFVARHKVALFLSR